MTIDALTRALYSLGLSVREFAAAVGTDPRTARRWFSGELPIPGWVPVTLELMKQNRALSAALSKHQDQPKGTDNGLRHQ